MGAVGQIVRTAVDSSWLEPNVATCCARTSSFSFMFAMKQYAPNIHIQTYPYCVHISFMRQYIGCY